MKAKSVSCWLLAVGAAPFRGLPPADGPVLERKDGRP